MRLSKSQPTTEMTKICYDNLHRFAWNSPLLFKNSSWQLTHLCASIWMPHSCFAHWRRKQVHLEPFKLFWLLVTQPSFSKTLVLKKRFKDLFMFQCSQTCLNLYTITWKRDLFYTLKSAVEFIHDQNWLNSSQTLIPMYSKKYKFYKVNNPALPSKIYVYIWRLLVFFIIKGTTN